MFLNLYYNKNFAYLKKYDIVFIYQINLKLITNFFYDNYLYMSKNVFHKLNLNYKKILKKKINNNLIYGENYFFFFKNSSFDLINILNILKNIKIISFKYSKYLNSFLNILKYSFLINYNSDFDFKLFFTLFIKNNLFVFLFLFFFFKKVNL